MSKKQQQRVRVRPSKVKVFSCVLILIAAVFVGLFINSATARSRFENEIAAINNVFPSGNTKKVNEILTRTVSSGNYAKVEASLKKYVGDLYDNISEINKVASSEVVYDSLEASYLAKHKDDLGATITKLKEASEKIKALTADAKKLYNEDDVMAYIEGQDLNDSFRGLFVDNAKAFYGDDDLKKNYENTLELLRSSVLVEIEAINFLKGHQADWQIKDDKLSFGNDDLSKQYTQILEKVASI